MPKLHPKPAVFQDIFLYPYEQTRRVLRHLAECPLCQDGLARRAPPERRPAGEGDRKVLPWRPPDDEYGRALDNVLGKLRPRIRAVEREEAEAPSRMAELKRQPAERREFLIRNSRPFQSFSLCRMILEESREASPLEPREGEAWAALALRLTGELGAESPGPRQIEDAKALSWAAIGNARRIASDLRGAEAAFRQADLCLRRGTGDQLQREEVLSKKASLRRAQSRYDEAVSLARRAASICLAAGEARRAADVFMGWSLTCREAGEPEAGLHLIQAASRLAGDSEDPWLKLALAHNRACCLVEAARPLEAQRLVSQSLSLYQRTEGPRAHLRRLWLEASIVSGLGRLQEAIVLLHQVRGGFGDLEDGVNSALCSLNLATVHARLGKAHLVRRFAREAVTLFEAHHVWRDALAARLLFEQAGRL